MGEFTIPIRGMSFAQRVCESSDSLKHLGGRALLALLGVVMGCAAIVALLTIGHSAAQDVMLAFKGKGTDTLVVTFPEKRDDRLLPPYLDLVAMRRAFPEFELIAELATYGTRMRANGRAVDARLVGASSELADAIGWRLTSGRHLSEFDGNSLFAVLGAAAARSLENEGRRIALDEKLQIGDYFYRIIGLAEVLPANPFLPFSADDAIFIPYEGLRRQMPDPKPSALIFKAAPGTDLGAAGLKLQAHLASSLRGRDVDVRIPRQWIEGMARQADTFSYLLGALGGLSLLVGGIGVMNVMLLNVAERRREIGLRRALGARPRDICLLFLLEAASLAAVGAATGALLGVLAAFAFTKISGWEFVLAPLALPLGVGSSLAVGLLSGLYPALAAARLQPVQALRDV
ncbi:ABC transporter permease [Achromobacter xylosoxidans]|uniref:ABC transporter permease n=1 Tax=Alcaligenes xylosoxydans xylosoxydans TaxID=85698 RepID=UPI00211AC2F6|nr:ABC transporter permease [Achromobacter xylosoxidans]